jgi:outer membrane protein TolC
MVRQNHEIRYPWDRLGPKAVRGLGLLALLLALLLFLGAPSPSGAEETGTLTLEDAVTQALAGSSMRAARAEADAAGASASAASWGRLPQLDLAYGWQRTDDPVLVFGSLLEQGRFTSSDFGSFDPSTGDLDLSTLNNPAPISNFRGKVGLFQPIWMGGSVTARLHAQQASASAALARSERAAEETAFQAERAFRLAILADEQVALLRDSWSLALTQEARVESLWTVGLALLADLEALRAHRAEAYAALAGSLADSVEARSWLGFVMGAEGPIGNLLARPDSTGSPAPSIAEALESAQERPDVEAAQAGVRAAEAERGLAASAYLPTLGVSAAAYHDSPEFLGEGAAHWVIGVGLAWRFDAGSPSGKKAAAARAVAAQENADTARRRAEHDVRVAYTKVAAASQRLEAYRAAVRGATEANRLVERRHEEGLATTLELTEAQTALTRTRLGELTAAHDLAISRAALRLAAGTPVPEEEVR